MGAYKISPHLRPKFKDARMIGRGLFTRCYHKPGSNRVLLVSRCAAKYVLATEGYGSSSLFPPLKYLEEHVYEAPFYPKESLNKLNSLHRAYYTCLRRMYVKAMNDYWDDFSISNIYWEELFEDIPFPHLRKALLDAYRKLSPSMEVNFEISPRNVKVHKGKLILLDVFVVY